MQIVLNEVKKQQSSKKEESHNQVQVEQLIKGQ